MRKLALLALAAPLVLLADPVAASAPAPLPVVGETRSATATFQLGGRDGRTWVVRFDVDEFHAPAAAPARSLRVSLRPCRTVRGRTECGAPRTYSVRLAEGGGAIADDLRSAYVRTRVLGAPLVLSWSVTAARASTLASATEDAVYVRHAYSGGSGEAAGVVLGPRCDTGGLVSGGYVIRRSAAPALPAPPRALPAALTPSQGWVPRCV